MARFTQDVSSLKRSQDSHDSHSSITSSSQARSSVPVLPLESDAIRRKD
jgi:hypothetical protein